jgi:hypothetical protein
MKKVGKVNNNVEFVACWFFIWFFYRVRQIGHGLFWVLVIWLVKREEKVEGHRLSLIKLS